MRAAIRPVLSVLLLTLCAGAWSSPRLVDAGEVPAPRVDRIDYAKPSAQLGLANAGKRTLSIASQLKGKTPLETLGRISRWLSRNVRRDDGLTGRWRPVDEILADGKRGGNADFATVFGVLARAAGIPTTWVKTMPVAWIAGFKAGGETLDKERGRIFLEMHLDGRWRLLDPLSARLYETYDTRTRLLPGNSFAYDKGGDPHALVLPNRLDVWKQQAEHFFRALDLAKVPWSTSRDLLARWRVNVVGRSGAGSYARAAAQTLGYSVQSSFDSQFDRNLAKARGTTLIVTCRGATPVLPKSYWATWLPPEYVKGVAKPGTTWLAHTLSDGTRVILILVNSYGPVELAVSEALEE